MNRLKRHTPSPAMIVALVALFIALGGAAYAGVTLSNNSVRSNHIVNGQVKTVDLANSAVTNAKLRNNAVNSAKVKDASLTGTDVAADSLTGAQVAEGTLGKVPSTVQADSATNASSLGGAVASEYQRKSGQSGQTLTGQLSQRYVGGSGGFTVTGASYPVPLPPSTPVPTLEFTTTTSATCPGIGQAPAGRLCIYGYNTSNVASVTTSGGFGGLNRLYGFSVDVFATTAANAGFMIASWAYQIP